MKYHQSNFRTVVKLFIFIISLFFVTHLYSQKNYIITKDYDNLKWSDFVTKVEQNYGLQFFYDENVNPDLIVKFQENSIPLVDLLQNTLKVYDLFASIDDHSGNIFITKNIALKTKLPEGFIPKDTIAKEEINKVEKEKVKEEKKDFLKTTKKFIAENYTVGTKKQGVNKKYATISGYILDSKTKEPVIGATILDKDNNSGTATDKNGYYELKVRTGKHRFEISNISSLKKTIDVQVFSDGKMDLFLDEKVVFLDDVIVRAEAENKVSGTQMGIEKLKIKSVKKIPLVFGEKDVMKVALLLPGVQSIGEGASGFNVRGSPTDQNIFYINNVPIYNTSHVAGFFSAFNSDAIDEFTLYKSNIPINYGGRLSSVFDIKTKNGSQSGIKANGGIGIITGRLMVEGPIKKDKSSFLVGVRSTYSDWVLRMAKNENLKNSNVNFADALTNFTFQLNQNNWLNIFTYFSHDKLDLASRSKYAYQNYGASINWKHFFKKKHSLELSFIHSGYNFDEENTEIASFSYEHRNKISHTELKANAEINYNEKHKFNAGLNAILYNIDRGNPEPLNEESSFKALTLGKEKGLEIGLFVGDEFKVSEKLTVNGGARFNIYSYLGPQKVYEYEPGLPMNEENIIDTLNFGSNKFIKTYSGLDLRIAANYLINDNLSIKASYNRLHQYIYMLSNTIAVAPNYKWKLCDYNTKPLIGDQFSAGIFSSLFGNRYEFSVEAFYKRTKNLVEIKNGASLFLNQYAEQSIVQGDLDAYGIEFMFKKKVGKTTGWINYTYSKTDVQVDSEFFENQINSGEKFPSNYDKPHSLNMVLTHDISRQINVSTNFVYSTGRPITYPTSIYFLDGTQYLNYSVRNDYRIPDYIRMDMSLTIEGNLKKNKLAHGSWTISVYNLLGRKNVYSVYFTKTDEKINGYKISVFGVPIFSITYNIKLGNYEN